MGLLNSVVADARSRRTPSKPAFPFNRPDGGGPTPAAPDKVVKDAPSKPGANTVSRVEKQATVNPEKQVSIPKIEPGPKATAKPVVKQKTITPKPVSRPESTPVKRVIEQSSKIIDIDMPKAVEQKTVQQPVLTKKTITPNIEAKKAETQKTDIEEVAKTTPAPEPVSVKKIKPEKPRSKQKTSETIQTKKAIPVSQQQPEEARQKNRPKPSEEQPADTVVIENNSLVEKTIQQQVQHKEYLIETRQREKLQAAEPETPKRAIELPVEPEPIKPDPKNIEPVIQADTVEPRQPMLVSKQVEQQTTRQPQAAAAIIPNIIEVPRSPEVNIGQVDVFIEAPAQPARRSPAPARPSVALASRHYLRRI